MQQWKSISPVNRLMMVALYAFLMCSQTSVRSGTLQKCYIPWTTYEMNLVKRSWWERKRLHKEQNFKKKRRRSDCLRSDVTTCTKRSFYQLEQELESRESHESQMLPSGRLAHLAPRSWILNSRLWLVSGLRCELPLTTGQGSTVVRISVQPECLECWEQT